MKKYLFPALALGLVMTSCQSDEPFAPVEGGEKQVTFTLNVPGELGTRAGATDNASDKGGWSNSQGNVSYTLVLSAEGHNQTYKKENVAGNTVTFSPTVVLGREYTVTAYAHFSDKAQENLTSITETKGINDESKDVYFFTTKENVSKPTINFADGTSYNFDLKRPYAKLRLIAEDYNTTDDTKPKTNITEVTVSYNNEVYTVFNAVEGEFNTKATKSYTKTWNADYYEQGVTSGDKTIFADYIPVNGTDVAPFTIKVKYSGANNEEYERVFAQDIPVRRNALTTLKGNFFTAGAKITVTVDDAFDSENSKEYNVWNGQSDTSWYNDTDTEFTLTNPQQLAGLAELVDGGNTFEGKTVKLGKDIYLYATDKNGDAICFDPIGSYRFDKVFKGTFDGQGHTIRSLNQNTWALNNGYNYNDCGLGLFGAAQDATIKNIIMDNANISGESGLCGVVAAVAENVTFENITVKNSKCADYQYYSGGIAGWVSGDNNKFINCNVDASTIVAAQWGDFDNSTGGVIGGVGGSSKVFMKDCNVACRIDAYNDVTSSYQWHAYRRCGMLIGNSGKTETVDGRTIAVAPQLTCENVTVTYGDWSNYTYCEFAGTSWPYVRVQAGVSNSAYSNPRYGNPTDANGNKVVDDNHVHNDGEDHHILRAFDQLYGGGQGVYGNPTHKGVTVVYDASCRRGVSTTAALNDALGKGLSVVLEGNIDMGSTQLAITGENQVVDLGGHTLTTANNWGGISLKNGACIKNGTITHAGNTAAIKAFNGTSVENVTINATCSTADKTVTGIAVQQGANVDSIKNVTINGVSQGIEVGYQATVGLIENAIVNDSNNGTSKGIGLVINGGKVGKAKDCTF